VPSVAKIAGWGKRRLPATALCGAPQPPIGTGPLPGPADPIGLTVELLLGSLGWTDISPFVLYRDSSVLVTITRGRPNETSAIQPQTASFQVNNRDGRFSPRNPTGPYYGNIGRNTQVRISRLQNGVRRYRFCGEVTSWPSTWDISGNDVWIDVTAAGQLRRLQQGTQTLGSAMYRAYSLQESGTLNPVAYWPCEDGTTATSFASGIKGNPNMSFAGTPTLASNSGFLCSLPLPVFNGATFTGQVPTAGTWTDNVVRFLIQIPTNGDADNGVILRFFTNGTVKRVDLVYNTAFGGELTVTGYDATGANLFTLGPVTTTQGALYRMSVALRTSGSNVTYELQSLTVGASSAGAASGTLTSAVIGPVTSVVFNASGAMTGTAVGHISVQPVWDTLFDLANQLQAWFNEGSPHLRVARLCSEQNVNQADFSVPGIAMGGNGVTMGYQTNDTLANLLQQVVDTDNSMLFEARDQLALIYRIRTSLCDQGTTYNPQRGLTLDFAQHQLSGPLNPLDDDANTRNDITVQAISGSFSQATLTAGALSTQPPPNGVGDYATTYSLSLGNLATSLADHAHWRLHLGTVDEPRYPQIMLNLRHPQFTGNIDLLNQALVLDIGDLVVVNNPPAWMPPDQIRQILQGYSETLGVFEHDMVLNCSPEAPYRVGIVGDAVLGRADTDGSTLAAPLGPALNANPFFTDGSLAEWSAVAASVAAVGSSGAASPLPAGGPTGYGALLTPDGSLSNCALSGGSTPGFYIPVAANGTYQVSALVYSPGGYANVEIGFDFYDVNQGYITTSSVLNSVAAGTWTALSTSQTAGGTAAFARPRIGEKSSPTAANTLYVASVVMWQGAVSVASTNTLLPLWTVSGGAFPFDVAVSPTGSGGERMTVTAVSGGSSPQSFTVARGVNGTAAALPAGRDVRLWQPCTVSL
jgi:hypothetical protein